MVTNDNVEEYFESWVSFVLDKGISLQLAALKEVRGIPFPAFFVCSKFQYFLLQGFDEVFEMHSLRAFTGEELRALVGGDPSPNWTATELAAHIEPKNGFLIPSVFFFVVCLL